MTRRPRNAPPRPSQALDQAADYGPGHKLFRGQLRSWGGAANVVIEERGDLDNPKAGRTIRGARRRIPVDDLLSRGTITQRHHDAVILLFDLYSLREGGSSVNYHGGSGGVPATSVAARKLIGATKARLADASMGQFGRRLFKRVIMDGETLGDFEKRYGLKAGAGTTRLRVTLTMLDEHFNPKSRR